LSRPGYCAADEAELPPLGFPAPRLSRTTLRRQQHPPLSPNPSDTAHRVGTAPQPILALLLRSTSQRPPRALGTSPAPLAASPQDCIGRSVLSVRPSGGTI